MTFSLPTAGLEGGPGGEGPSLVATTTAFDASSTTALLLGDEAMFNVSVTPATAEGSVQFFTGDVPLGAPVPLAGGAATLRTAELPLGTHSISAQFTPTDAEAFVASSAAAIQVRVSERGNTVIDVRAPPSTGASKPRSVTTSTTPLPSAARQRSSGAPSRRRIRAPTSGAGAPAQRRPMGRVPRSHSARATGCTSNPTRWW